MSRAERRAKARRERKEPPPPVIKWWAGAGMLSAAGAILFLRFNHIIGLSGKVQAVVYALIVVVSFAMVYGLTKIPVPANRNAAAASPIRRRILFFGHPILWWTTEAKRTTGPDRVDSDSSGSGDSPSDGGGF